jgi:hypothetical protein
MTGARERLAMALSGRRATVWAVAVGLALRVAAIVLLVRFPLAGEARSYFEMAGQLLDGARFAPAWPPGIPHYVAFFESFLGRGQVAAMAPMLLWYLAFCFILYALLVRVCGRRAANVGLWAFAVFPTFVYHSVVPLPRLPLSVCFLLVALLLLVLRGRRSLFIPAAIGAALGAAVLMRPSAVLLALGVPVFIAVRWRSARAALVTLGVAAALVAPWVLKVRAMTGELVFVHCAASRSLYLGNNEWTPLYKTWWLASHDEPGAVPNAFTVADGRLRALAPHEEETAYRALAAEHIRSNPALFALRTLNRARAFFAFDTCAGAALTKLRGLPVALGLSVIALDALFYVALMALSLIAFGAPRGIGVGRVTRATILWVVAAYALPFWAALSHPMNHVAVVPLLAVPGVVLLAQAGGMDRAALARTVTGIKRRRSLLLALIVFLAIQVEWIVVMGAGFLGRG